ncbi:MAG: T9SS type A sorting domain-containing protein [Bacteroidetes bacterium]|nr:T9SS type A sorting domain-containing protein [Bacteroidota bacterium]
MKLKYSLILILVILTSFLYAQQMDIVWQACLGTDEDDRPGCISKTKYGVLVSQTISKEYPGISNFHGGADPWIVSLDSIGNIIWENCYGGSGGEGFYKIIELPNNEYYLIGGTNSDDGDVQSNNHSSYEVWVVKIDSIGHIIWERCYGSYSLDDFQDATLTTDGGLIVGSMVTTDGGDISTFYGVRDVWLFRIDSDGNMIWEKSYGNHSMNRINSMIATSQGTYMFTGSFYEKGGMIDCQKDESEMDTDVWVVEIDINGEILFQNCYGGSYSETGTGIVELDDGYALLALTNSNDQDVSGFHGIAGQIIYDIWLFKINTNGNLLWQICLGGTDLDAAASVFKTSNNGLTIIGYTASNDGDVVGNHSENGFADIWIVNIDSTGLLQWQQCIGSGGRESLPLHGATQINNYNYAITCETGTLHGDVECIINPGGQYKKDAWVINIKDCSQFQPSIPQKPIGKDYLCVNTDSITTYSTSFTNGAWYYEWELQPETAGTLIQDNLTTQIHWNPIYEGPATIKVRSSNDCGESEWSDSLIIQTYMCLGTEENKSNSNLRVYPNPATSTLFVELENSTQQSYNIEVYNSVGSKVYSVKVINKNTTIDVSGWNSGIYVVKVFNGKWSFNRKIIVN